MLIAWALDSGWRLALFSCLVIFDQLHDIIYKRTVETEVDNYYANKWTPLILQGASACGGERWINMVSRCAELLICCCYWTVASLETSHFSRSAFLLPWDFCETWSAIEFFFSVFLLTLNFHSALNSSDTRGLFLCFCLCPSLGGLGDGWVGGVLIPLHQLQS